MNVTILQGRLGAEPQIRAAEGKTTICNFRIATNDGYGDNKKTNWHNVTLFGTTAEKFAKNVKVGDNVSVYGRIDYTNKDKDGTKITYTNIVGNSWEFGPGNKKETANEDTDSLSVPF